MIWQRGLQLEVSQVAALRTDAVTEGCFLKRMRHMALTRGRVSDLQVELRLLLLVLGLPKHDLDQPKSVQRGVPRLLLLSALLSKAEAMEVDQGASPRARVEGVRENGAAPKKPKLQPRSQPSFAARSASRALV